ncbi:antitoxin MazE family protein [Desulfobulbus elongatus]|uniref:antitoxin MazE family protein n=1 Tax=Desulfobulbus elongatus TaxID=53332 RepID=UPI000482AC44|nr:antitoxin MazE family protein [Desulfobulbus elongatus]
MSGTTERVRKHREKLRQAGLRPVQIWIPDTRRPGFAEECRRQSLVLLNDPHETEIMTWVEAVTDFEDWK